VKWLSGGARGCPNIRSEPLVVPAAGLAVAPSVRFEVRLDLQERFALSLGHAEVAEQAAKEGDHRVPDEVGTLAVCVRHRLVDLQHDGGRERDGEHHRRVGEATGVRWKVLALDDGQHGHEPDVDEEFCAAHAGQQQPTVHVDRGPDADAASIVPRQQRGYKHVAQSGAHTRCHE